SSTPPVGAEAEAKAVRAARAPRGLPRHRTNARIAARALHPVAHLQSIRPHAALPRSHHHQEAHYSDSARAKAPWLARSELASERCFGRCAPCGPNSLDPVADVRSFPRRDHCCGGRARPTCAPAICRTDKARSTGLLRSQAAPRLAVSWSRATRP